jgi:hypothetical protein
MQLNMGEGKTRIIIPMLLLWWLVMNMREETSKVIRLCFLPPLVGEAFDFLHRTLCASAVLPCRKLVRFSFNRDVNLTSHQAEKLNYHLQQVARVAGAVVTTPQDLLSLKLKWHELYEQLPPEQKKPELIQTELMTELHALINSNRYRDVLDESDLILNHKFQLVYALGSPQPLNSGNTRWKSVGLLLDLLCQAEQMKNGNEIYDSFLSNPVFALLDYIWYFLQ